MAADKSSPQTRGHGQWRRLRRRAGFIHPRLGDLARPEAVKPPPDPEAAPVPDLGLSEPIIHLTVTARCYARCVGCINRVFASGEEADQDLAQTLEAEPERDAALILGLAEREAGRGLLVAFYGGEPLLAADKMERLRRILAASRLGPKIRYMLYTNGELLARNFERFPELMKSIWLFSISIDGDAAQHARVRPGTSLPKIIDNLRQVRTRMKGSVLMWSTIREGQSLWNCFQQFLRLKEAALADHFFWHWAETPTAIADFPGFAAAYGQDLERLLNIYLERLEAGELLSVIHLNELVVYLLTGQERGHTACAVELARNFDLLGGRVFPCADLPHVGPLGGLDERGGLEVAEGDLSFLVDYKMDLGCFECGVHFYCGGRCPVQALVGSPERTLQYCQLMRLHVGLIQERLAQIEAGLKRLHVSPEDLHRRSAFLARYTDVVP